MSTAKGDEFYEDPPPEPISGAAAGPMGTSEISDTLLDLIGAVAKLNTMLSEANAETFEDIQVRLSKLKEHVAALPSSGPPVKKAGFKRPSKTKK